MQPVSFLKPFSCIAFVFPRAFNQVAGYASVQGAITLTGKDIDRRLHGLILLDSRLRGNDEASARMRAFV